MKIYKNKIFIPLKNIGTYDVQKSPAETKWTEKTYVYNDINGNVGLVVPVGYIVIDFDEKKYGRRIFDFVTKNKIKCLISQTKKGFHYMFKVDENLKIKPSVRVKFSCGVMADIRTSYRDTNDKLKQSFIAIKIGSEERFLKDYDYDLEELDFLPNELLPFKIQNSQKASEIVNNWDVGSRNNNLRDWALLLTNQFGKEKIEAIVNNINNFILEEPLTKEEIKNILNEEYIDDRIKVVEESFKSWRHPKTNAFDLSKFVDYIINKYNLFWYNNLFYINNKKGYTASERVFKRIFDNLDKDLKPKDLKDIYEMLTIRVDKTIESVKKHLCLTKNKIISLENPFKIETLNETKDLILNQVNIEYNPDAKDVEDRVENWLKTISLNPEGKYDPEARLMLLEMVGAMFFHSNSTLQKMWFLKGEGGCGKSTFLDYVTLILGEENVSAVSIEVLQNDVGYERAGVIGKLANISDENKTNKKLRNTTILNAYAVGSRVTTRQIYGSPQTAKSHATLVFAVNRMPQSDDDTTAWRSRVKIIPFYKIFRDDATVQVVNFLENKGLLNEENKQYFFNICLKAYAEILQKIKNKEEWFLTRSEGSILEEDEYNRVKNNIDRWLEDRRHTIDKFENKQAEDFTNFVADYHFWITENSGGRNSAFNEKYLRKYVKNKYGLETQPRHFKNENGEDIVKRIWIKKKQK